MLGFAKGGRQNYQEQMCGSYNLKLSAIAEHIQSKLIHYQQPGKNSLEIQAFVFILNSELAVFGLTCASLFQETLL